MCKSLRKQIASVLGRRTQYATSHNLTKVANMRTPMGLLVTWWHRLPMTSVSCHDSRQALQRQMKTSKPKRKARSRHAKLNHFPWFGSGLPQHNMDLTTMNPFDNLCTLARVSGQQGLAPGPLTQQWLAFALLRSLKPSMKSGIFSLMSALIWDKLFNVSTLQLLRTTPI